MTLPTHLPYSSKPSTRQTIHLPPSPAIHINTAHKYTPCIQPRSGCTTPHLPSAPYVYTSVTIGPPQRKGHYLRDYNSLYNGNQGHVPGIYIQEQDPAIYTSRHICDLFLSLRVGFFSTCQMVGGLHRVPPQQGSQPILSRVIEPALGLVASSIGGGPLACLLFLACEICSFQRCQLRRVHVLGHGM